MSGNDKLEELTQEDPQVQTWLIGKLTVLSHLNHEPQYWLNMTENLLKRLTEHTQNINQLMVEELTHAIP